MGTTGPPPPGVCCRQANEFPWTRGMAASYHPSMPRTQGMRAAGPWGSFVDGVDDLEEAALTYDYRQVTQNSGNSFVPAGTSATAHALRYPRAFNRLSSFFAWAVEPPGAGESVAIRLFRFTTTFLQQITTTFVLDAGSFVSSTKIDLTGNIIPGIALGPDDVIACSFVQAGVQGLQPLLCGWTLTDAPFPPATILVVDPADPPMWPPS